ncbi:MAG TPA: hypothetical protein VGP30_06250, partial [Candidatus Limnocylindrales bacterium]|nr:hypothetical protein [Candidatus Limnocylindrales bacterium]
ASVSRGEPIDFDLELGNASLRGGQVSASQGLSALATGHDAGERLGIGRCVIERTISDRHKWWTEAM